MSYYRCKISDLRELPDGTFTYSTQEIGCIPDELCIGVTSAELRMRLQDLAVERAKQTKRTSTIEVSLE